MIYLFGLVDAENAADLEHHLVLADGDGAPRLSAIATRLFVICEDHDGSEVLPRRRAMLRHARVLEHAMHAGTVLPMQFGMLAASEEVVADRVALKAREVAAAIARLRGRVELGVRITGDEDASLAATLEASPALRDMRNRLSNARRAGHFEIAEFGRALGEATARRRADEQRLATARLAPFADTSVLKAPESDTQVLRAEFLVDRAATAQFSEVVEAFCGASRFSADTPLKAQIIGPGPAYNFLNLSLGDAPGEVAA